MKIHDFDEGTIIGTNALYAAGTPAGTRLDPGFGLVLAFADAPFRMTSDNNVTPVVKPSVSNAPAPGVRGTLTIREDGGRDPCVRLHWLGRYRDPTSGTNDLPAAGNSLSLAPQFRGFALVPHSLILPGPFGGVDATIDPATFPASPGADAAGTPFGLDNAEPLARDDIFTVSEDSLAALDLLLNDHDSDGNDRLVIVDVSPASDPDAGDTAFTNSLQGAALAVSPAGSPLRGSRVWYDPRLTPVLQQLPVGVEMNDSFHYEIIDIGSGSVEGYAESAGQTAVNATHHRLSSGSEIVISGASTTNYNGTFAVTVVDADTFTIPVDFAGASGERGVWETVFPRLPTCRDEAVVTVRVMGENDPPAATLDTITNVTEATTLRVMVRPELAGQPVVFPPEPVPPPVVSLQNLLGNDDDIDTDDAWSDLQVVGVLGNVNTIADYSGTAGATPVVVHAPAHGLATGDTVLIANYGGHAAYCGYHVVTVLNADAFTIPTHFSDNHAVKGVWAVLEDANRLQTVTAAGVPVSLTLRFDPREDHLLYRAGESAFLNGLAEGEIYVDRFWYAVADRHGAIGIGPVDVEVLGLNDVPVGMPDPGTTGLVYPLITPFNTLESVLADGLDLMYTLPPASGRAGRTDLFARDPGGTIPGTLALRDFFATDEDTPLAIDPADLLANDYDIDRLDILSIAAVDAQSREGAAVSLSGGEVLYDPVPSASLQALVRAEMRIDTFMATVVDSRTGGSVTSLVAVLVSGVNDQPSANPETLLTHEDERLVFDPRVNDSDPDINGTAPDDRLRIVPVADLLNPGLSDVDLTPTNAIHDATVSGLLNQLADWQVFTNECDYTLTDNSFLLPVDDECHVLAGATSQLLDVLANDRDFTDGAGTLAILDAGPALHGGDVGIVSNGLFLVYHAPPGFVGDDTFRYTIGNSAGDSRSGRVTVRSVVPALNGILHAADDHYIIAAGETVAMPVTANDGVPPGGVAGLAITGIFNASVTNVLAVVGDQIVCTATNGVGSLTFSYTVTAGGSATGRADVVALVVDRRGTLGVLDDAFSVPPGSQGNVLDVLANDGLVNESTAHLRIAGLAEPASHGTVSTNITATALVYTPAPGFVGVERIRYVATDRVGGTGTGQVSIAVGRVAAVGDFFKVEAANTNAVLLNVLANDRTLPETPTTLTLVSVAPSGATAIGTLGINGPATHLRFLGNGAVGQTHFTYVLADASSPPRLATGVVSIATVAPGTYANPDRYRVRSGGSGYVLDVLVNDRGFPGNNRAYSVIGLGSGADAPNAGGLVAIENNKLIYTPAPGFVGEERFTYMLSDAVSTDVAQVTVAVVAGDLFANDDAYDVYFEWDANDGAPRAFQLPVTLNDRLLPPVDQVFGIVTLGVGPNAPDAGGAVSIAPDGLSLIYRPGAAPATDVTERFTYEILDDTGQRAAAQVRVRVRNRADNLVALTCGDAFAVARNSVNNLMPVLANDFILPGSAAGWTISGVSDTQAGGTVRIIGASVRYTPPTGFAGVDAFTYSVSDGLGGTGSGAVTVRVGALPTLVSRFAVLVGSDSNVCDVLANDALTPEYAGEYALDSVFGVTAGGSVSIGPGGHVLYTPAPSHAGAFPFTEQFLYTVLDDSSIASTGLAEVVVYDPASGRDTGTVTLVVEGRNDPPEIHDATTNAPITDKESAAVFGGVTLVEVDEQLQERVDVTVAVDDPAKGGFTNLQAFVHLGEGQYALSNVTAAAATAAIRQLVYVPVENRITVPTNETAVFTITVSDRKAPPVTDTQTTLDVWAVNDASLIAGTQADQLFFCQLVVKPFSGVLVAEVDDLALQPLVVTVTIGEPAQGSLQNTGDFAPLGGGVYQATNLTAAAAMQQLQAMEFAFAPDLLPPAGVGTTTHLQLAVDDGFAPPVTDDVTSVIAMRSYVGALESPTAVTGGSFGQAVDIGADFAVVGAPTADARGADSGAAFLYRLEPGSTNLWTEWRQLLPASLTAGNRFGRSVSLSEDFLAVGASEQVPVAGQTGAVYLFRRQEGGTDNWGEWMRIAPTNLPGSSRFGYAVALHDDLLAVGAPDAALPAGASGAGAVFLFKRHHGGANAWGEIMRWSPAGTGADGADFGWSVAMSDDTLVVGAPKFNADPATVAREGGVYLFQRDPNDADAWSLRQAIPGAGTSTVDFNFGWSVAVGDGRLAVGAPSTTVGAVANAGRVLLYERPASTNDFAYSLSIDRVSDPERRFGYSVAVDGERLLAGAPENPFNDNLGASFLFVNRAGVWTLVTKLTRPAGSVASLYGRAVAMGQGNGIIGAPASLSGTTFSEQGHAFLYRFDYTVPDADDDLTSRERWDVLYFGDELGNPWNTTTLWGVLADPDRDGRSNDEEYAFMGDPLVSQPSGLVWLSSDAAGNWVIEYERRANDPSITFTLEASTDLQTWFDPSAFIISETAVPAATESEWVTVLLPPMVPGNARFFRVKASW